MKKLMILGAGVYQIPLIKKANEMGIETIVVSIPGKYPGFDYAKKVYYEDTTDCEKILAIARKERINGIVTAGSDVAVVTVGKVCDELGLCGLSYEAALIATDKRLMKECYEKSGVRTARFRQVYFEKNLEEQLVGLQFPLIFKAVDSSGSRGIVRVNTISDFADAINNVKNYTKKDYFIVEEFLVGEEFGAQAFIKDGKIQFILPHGDYVFQGDTGVPIGHWVPFDLKEHIIEDAKKQLELAARAMKLDNCALNADFILVDGKTYVLEIGGRSGATCLAELVSIYYGFDYYEKLIQAALGEDVNFDSDQCNTAVAMLLRSDISGTIESMADMNGQSDNEIVEVQYDYKPGDSVNAFRIGPDRIGHVILQGNDLPRLQLKIEDVINNIHINVI